MKQVINPQVNRQDSLVSIITLARKAIQQHVTLWYYFSGGLQVQFNRLKLVNQPIT